MIKRFGLSGLLVLLVLVPLVIRVSQVRAQSVTLPLPGNSANVPAEVNDLNNSQNAAQAGNANLGDLTKNVTGYQVASMGCILGGCPGATGQQQSGVAQSLVAFIGSMYANPPASGQAYMADVINDLKLGGAQPAYAQGVGFSALNPILSVWKIMRNISYFFFVIALIVIGIMIMLRQRVGSQAAITAQQAIPSIIIALITVTFSYAIAGLLIDAMYLIMFLIAGLFNKVSLVDGNVITITTNLIFNGDVANSASKLGELVNSALGNNIVTQVAGFITGIGAWVIILVVIVFNMFKLFFALLNVYVELIINIAFSPVILMTGAIPGQNPFGSWLKNIVGNLAVFPVILLLLVMFDVIKNSISQTTGGFVPPYLGTGAAGNVLPFLAGLGLLLALPQAVDETKKAFGVQKAGFFGNLVQAGLKNFTDKRGAGIAVGGAIAGAGGGALIGAGVGAVSALRGPGTMDEKLRRLPRMAGRDALKGTFLGGAGLPAAATVGPQLARGLGRTMIRQAQDYASQETIRDVISRVRSRQGEKQVEKYDTLGNVQKAAKLATPQATTAQVPPPPVPGGAPFDPGNR